MPTPGQEFTQYKSFHRRTSSPEEMNEKRAKGLCFFCDEKYVIGHKCRNSRQLYILELKDQEENDQDFEEEV